MIHSASRILNELKNIQERISILLVEHSAQSQGVYAPNLTTEMAFELGIENFDLKNPLLLDLEDIDSEKSEEPHE